MRSLLLVFVVLFIVGCCHIPPGQIKKQSAPGQIQHHTGYNPASGKIKR